jgi:hypothetical protein
MKLFLSFLFLLVLCSTPTLAQKNHQDRGGGRQQSRPSQRQIQRQPQHQREQRIDPRDHERGIEAHSHPEHGRRFSGGRLHGGPRGFFCGGFQFVVIESDLSLSLLQLGLGQ